MFNFFKRVFKKFVSFVTNKFNSVISKLYSVISVLKLQVVSYSQYIWGVIKSTISGFFNIIKDFFDSVCDFIKSYDLLLISWDKMFMIYTFIPKELFDKVWYLPEHFNRIYSFVFISLRKRVIDPCKKSEFLKKIYNKFELLSMLFIIFNTFWVTYFVYMFISFSITYQLIIWVFLTIFYHILLCYCFFLASFAALLEESLPKKMYTPVVNELWYWAYQIGSFITSFVFLFVLRYLGRYISYSLMGSIFFIGKIYYIVGGLIFSFSLFFILLFLSLFKLIISFCFFTNFDMHIFETTFPFSWLLTDYLWFNNILKIIFEFIYLSLVKIKIILIYVYKYIFVFSIYIVFIKYPFFMFYLTLINLSQNLLQIIFFSLDLFKQLFSKMIVVFFCCTNNEFSTETKFFDFFFNVDASENVWLFSNLDIYIYKLCGSNFFTILNSFSTTYFNFVVAIIIFFLKI